MNARFSWLTALLLGLGVAGAQANEPSAPSVSAAVCPALLNHNLPRLQDGKPQSLCQYGGKVLLVVNTASYCGFTSQYKGLEAMYQKYKDAGLVVLGFPSGDFFQEKSNDKEIADFCFNTYGVIFPMFSKSAVRGADVNPFYKQLIAATGKSPSWNFNKYLVDRQGRKVQHFGSSVKPTDAELITAMEALLKQKP